MTGLQAPVGGGDRRGPASLPDGPKAARQEPLPDEIGDGVQRPARPLGRHREQPRVLAVEDHLDSQSPEKLAPRPAGGAGDPYALYRGELDEEAADAARRAVHQQRVALRRPEPIE
ncbi:MAG TPA: hypothetical protein VFW14_09980 [Gaiellales bacterium]|nr:hypothetical protein [Gaiellales bacterium]